MHGDDEDDGREQAAGGDGVVEWPRAASAELEGSVAGEDVVEAENGDDGEEGSEVEDENADGGGGDYYGVGIEKKASGAGVERAAFAAEKCDEAEAEREGSGGDVDQKVRDVRRGVVMEHGLMMR